MTWLAYPSVFRLQNLSLVINFVEVIIYFNRIAIMLTDDYPLSFRGSVAHGTGGL
jgi:hypothetical protein